MNRRTRLLLVVASTVALLAALITPADAAAQRASCHDGTCQNLTHVTDDGYDACFAIKGIRYRTDGTWYNTSGSICEGHSAYGDGWSSAEQVYVNAGTQIKCKDPVLLAYGITKWQIQWDATGWHPVGTYPLYASYSCVYQLD